MPENPSKPLPATVVAQQNTECILESREGGCGRLRVVKDQKLLALIEYWPVNADYEGGAPCAAPQGDRGNVGKDEESLRRATPLPLPDGPRRVWVRAVDTAVDMAAIAATMRRDA